MRLTWVLAILLSTSLLAQPARRPVTRGESHAINAELMVKQALEQMGNDKKAFERDIGVVRHLKAADAALRDPMQPAAAVQKAFDHVSQAERLVPAVPPEVAMGVLRVRQQLEAARRSPGSADFGRLRSFLNEEAIGPASRVLVRRATRLQGETIAWLKVQESISEILRGLTEIVGESLREAE
jgi:hypothetical protein